MGRIFYAGAGILGAVLLLGLTAAAVHFFSAEISSDIEAASFAGFLGACTAGYVIFKTAGFIYSFTSSQAVYETVHAPAENRCIVYSSDFADSNSSKAA